MSRGIGAVEVIRETLPSWALEAFREVTVLGDTIVLAFVFLLVYWLIDREDGFAVLLIFLVGVGVLTIGKLFFGLPRPPQAAASIGITGYGFPSGHAFNATVGYGLLARCLPNGTPTLRYGMATVGIGIVGLSRIAIGAHYAIDVVAGILFGVVYLVVAWTLLWPRRQQAVSIYDQLRPW